MRGVGLLCLVISLFSPLAGCSAAVGKLTYYSDYFSFVGRDSAGYVAFALDNNRGVDGDRFQAEHFAVFYDEQAGWIEIKGTGAYDNSQGILERIPDSASFTFEGLPAEGLTIRSVENRLTLKIAPIVTQLKEENADRYQSWGSAPAVLTWKGREITGRVIYEWLVVHNWNRLTRTYLGTWNNFQGFYLALGEGTPQTWQDFFLRSTGKGEGRLAKGFIATENWDDSMISTSFNTSDHALNFGFYRWPQRWEIAVRNKDSGAQRDGQLHLHQVSRKNVSNWIVGGFAMAVVEGEFVSNGMSTPVLGLVELIK